MTSLKIFIDSGGIGAGVFDYLITDDDLKHKAIAIDNSKQILDKDGKGRKLQKTTKYSQGLTAKNSGQK